MIGLCQCGCGEKTKDAPRTRASDGWIKGVPLKYVKGHDKRHPRAAIRFGLYRGESVAFIPLTHKREAVIDVISLPKLTGLWCVSSSGYVVQNERTKCGRGIRLLHRVVTDCPIDKEVDHRNGDKFDNRLSNLRVTEHCKNMQNQRLQGGRSSLFKGVCFVKATGKWEAYIKAMGKKRHLGVFAEESAAALKYDQSARELFGEYALCNFPIGIVA
jgi:hypothetical protein